MADPKTISFNEASFNQLIAFITACRDDLNKAFLQPTTGLMLDGTLGTELKIGSADWPVVGSVKDGANSFGGSVHNRLDTLTSEWDTYIDALNDAKAVFKKADDLAQMSASDFLSQYPDLAPSGTGAGSGTGL